jgi:hypothetical protein
MPCVPQVTTGGFAAVIAVMVSDAASAVETEKSAF